MKNISRIGNFLKIIHPDSDYTLIRIDTIYKINYSRNQTNIFCTAGGASQCYELRFEIPLSFFEEIGIISTATIDRKTGTVSNNN